MLSLRLWDVKGLLHRGVIPRLLSHHERCFLPSSVLFDIAAWLRNQKTWRSHSKTIFHARMESPPSGRCYNFYSCCMRCDWENDFLTVLCRSVLGFWGSIGEGVRGKNLTKSRFPYICFVRHYSLSTNLSKCFYWPKTCETINIYWIINRQIFWLPQCCSFMVLLHFACDA